MDSLMSAFAAGDFSNNDADFMLDQFLCNEVVEGCSSTSVTPATWSFLENDTNLIKAGQSLFHHVELIYTESNHLSTDYGFSGLMEVGMFPQQLSNSNVRSEYYMTDTIASPASFFSNNVLEEGSMSIPNRPSNLKRNLDVCTSEVENKKTQTMNHVNLCKQMSSSSFSSDDPVTTSEDTKLVTSHDKNGKKKRRRGTTIDPQSLYARKRRERINQRLRILQNLVPNGTKVDISTMLEEAVSYVKFLQKQIKLLSSDDLWMYAPIAYNGIDAGLDMRLPENL